jgi:hypothetical protein
MFNEYKCKICEKEYKSYQSLWNHNKIKHNNNPQIPTIIHNLPQNPTQNKCIRCNKIFSRLDSLKRHQTTCKIDIMIELKEEITELKEEINKLKNKSSNKTINDNKQINNGTINNNNINIKVSLGNENIDDLSKKDQLKILNSGYMGLIKIIELLNLNPDLPQYNNILVTNLKDKFCKIYDEDIKKYKTVNKKEMVENIITVRTNNLKEIYNKYNNKNNKMHQLVLLLIDKLNSITIEDDELMKYYKDLCEEIILLIYNKTEIYEKNIIN